MTRTVFGCPEAGRMRGRCAPVVPASEPRDTTCRVEKAEDHKARKSRFVCFAVLSWIGSSQHRRPVANNHLTPSGPPCSPTAKQSSISSVRAHPRPTGSSCTPGRRTRSPPAMIPRASFYPGMARIRPAAPRGGDPAAASGAEFKRKRSARLAREPHPSRRWRRQGERAAQVLTGVSCPCFETAFRGRR